MQKRSSGHISEVLAQPTFRVNSATTKGSEPLLVSLILGLSPDVFRVAEVNMVLGVASLTRGNSAVASGKVMIGHLRKSPDAIGEHNMRSKRFMATTGLPNPWIKMKSRITAIKFFQTVLVCQIRKMVRVSFEGAYFSNSTPATETKTEIKLNLRLNKSNIQMYSLNN